MKGSVVVVSAAAGAAGNPHARNRRDLGGCFFWLTVGDDHGGALGDGLLCDLGGEIVRQEDCGRSLGGLLGVLEEEAYVVPGTVCQLLGVS